MNELLKMKIQCTLISSISTLSQKENNLFARIAVFPSLFEIYNNYLY